MGRARRTDTPGTWYHVVNRGASRQTVFVDDRDRVEFLRLVGVAHERFGVRLHAYCLMTNHYHLLVECPDGKLSEAMHLVGSVFVRHANERHGRDGPLFTDRFYARPVVDDTYLLRVVRYIHRNPLAFLDPSRLRSYRWSSFRTYLGDRRRPEWLETEMVLEMAGGAERLEVNTIGAAAPGGAVSAASWSAAIDLMIDTHLADVPSQSAARTVGVLLFDRVDPARNDVLATLLGFPNVQARRMALSRARRRAREHPEIDRAVDEVLGLVA